MTREQKINETQPRVGKPRETILMGRRDADAYKGLRPATPEFIRRYRAWLQPEFGCFVNLYALPLV